MPTIINVRDGERFRFVNTDGKLDPNLQGKVFLKMGRLTFRVDPIISEPLGPNQPPPEVLYIENINAQCDVVSDTPESDRRRLMYGDFNDYKLGDF